MFLFRTNSSIPSSAQLLGELEVICRDNGNVDKLDHFLQQHKIDVNVHKLGGGFSALHLCCLHSHLPCVELLVNKYQADVKVIRIEDGANPLHVACMGGSLSVCAFLIGKSKSLVVSKSNLGFTPLHYACLSGRLEIQKLLIEKGAPVNSRSQVGTNHDYLLSEYFGIYYMNCTS